MEKIRQLRRILNTKKIDGYLIPKNDEFFGEYTKKHNDRLKYISNFSGSYGFALVLRDRNYLFIDGRYTLQAMKQSGRFFKIITFPKKMPFDILKKRKLLIGFDSRLFTKKTLDTLFYKCYCKFIPFKDNLIDQIWKREIKKTRNKFYNLSIGWQI